MKGNRVAIVVLVLLILCICTLLSCLVAYLLLGWPTAISGFGETPSPVGPVSTPTSSGAEVPLLTPVSVTPMVAADGPLSTEPGTVVVNGSEMSASHRISFDGEDALHLVWGNVEEGSFTRC